MESDTEKLTPTRPLFSKFYKGGQFLPSLSSTRCFKCVWIMDLMLVECTSKITIKTPLRLSIFSPTKGSYKLPSCTGQELALPWVGGKCWKEASSNRKALY